MDEKLKSENMQKRAVFYACYILRAIRAGRCRERRYADHIFIQIYFRMHHFVIKFSKFSSPQAARGHWIDPLTKIMRTFQSKIQFFAVLMQFSLSLCKLLNLFATNLSSRGFIRFRIMKSYKLFKSGSLPTKLSDMPSCICYGFYRAWFCQSIDSR